MGEDRRDGEDGEDGGRPPWEGLPEGWRWPAVTPDWGPEVYGPEDIDFPL